MGLKMVVVEYVPTNAERTEGRPPTEADYQAGRVFHRVLEAIVGRPGEEYASCFPKGLRRKDLQVVDFDPAVAAALPGQHRVRP